MKDTRREWLRLKGCSPVARLVAAQRRWLVALGAMTAMLVSLGATGKAQAQCAFPKATQVVVYAGSNYTGACAVLSAGNWSGSDLIEAGIPSAVFQSLWVGNQVRGVVHPNIYLTAGEVDLEGGAGYPTLGPNYGLSQGPLSINVQLTGGRTLPLNYVGNWPNDRAYQWSNGYETQGLTHDSSNWFLTTKGFLLKVPLTTNIAADIPGLGLSCNPPGRNCVPICTGANCAGIPAALAPTYNHFGDPDVFGSFVFIPVEPVAANTKARVAVFSAIDLHFIGSNEIPNTTPDGGGKYHAGWLSLQPTGASTAILYTSGAIDASTGTLQKYTVDLRGLVGPIDSKGLIGPFMWHMDGQDLPLFNRDGNRIVLPQMQGGDVTPDGHTIFLSNGCCGDNSGPWGVHAFDLSTGAMQAESTGAQPFNFTFDQGTYQEPEGLDYFDVRGLGLLNIPDSQLHVALFGNLSEDMWLKHYSFPPAATYFAPYENWWPYTFDGGYGTMLGDIDADGRADLVGLGAGYVGVVRSQGRSFGGYESGLADWFWGSHGTFLCDVDGDKRSDLVAATDSFVAVRRSVASQYSSASQLFGAFETWYGAGYYGSNGTLCGDVDGDGKADLVALNPGQVSVMRSTGSTLGPIENGVAASFWGGRGTYLADVDGDGRADLVAVSDGYIAVRRATGAGVGHPLFGAAETWSSATFVGSHGTFVGDVTGDGKADLVGLFDGNVQVMVSTGTGFAAATPWWVQLFSGNHGNFLGDLDGDGRADVVGAGDGYIGAIRAVH
jgi:FG-GAP-like repeat